MAKRGKQTMRHRRHQRLRQILSGTRERPRLAVYRSLTHVYAQLVDDTAGQTLASASSLAKAFKTSGKKGGNIDGARLVGEAIAEEAAKLGVQTVAFDRGGYRYHGRVKALAEAARAKGLKF